MNRVFNKVILGLFSIALTYNSAIALESEFKNSLVKVDLTKINESTYDITLYTQNKYSEPIKILKKSDLSYYILLPETKNNVSKTSGGPDIRNISTDLYPYAGADVDNGFTKITINTTKPLNFKINTRSVAAASKIAKNASEEAIAMKPKTTAANSETTQKKNLASSNSKTTLNETEKKESKSSQKVAIKEKIKKVDAPKAETTNTVKKIEAPEKKEIIATPKENINLNEAVKKELEVTPENITEEAPAPQEVLVELDENKIIEEDLTPKEIITENEEKEIEQIVNGSKSVSNPIFDKITNLETKITRKLNEKGITLVDLFLIFAATVLTFIIVFAILTKKNKHNVAKKINSSENEELYDNQTEQNYAQEEPKNDGQYFVFDKSIKQTGFCDPATSTIKRNYELSSYEPDLKNRYNRNESTTHHSNREKELQNDSEYDIIQKILKEDSFIDISANEYKEAHEALNEAPITKTVQSPIKSQAPAVSQVAVEPISEPTVLSSVEVAPERGFMCVSYNDNINLMGYIFDDVFPLYNFKLPKLENYDIKFRLSEKDDKAARFIVKIAGTKMMVKITKTSMNMEVLL